MLWQLLKLFGNEAPAPLLVNTSFNLFGEPLVVKPRDAVRSYFCSGAGSRAGFGPPVPPNDIYPCKPGGPNDWAYVFNSHNNPEHWRRLCGIIGRPELVFLDEPTAGLDPQARLATWELIAGLRAAGAAVILTTHNMDEAQRLADQVAVVDHGRLVAEGSPADLTGTAGQLRFRPLSRS